MTVVPPFYLDFTVSAHITEVGLLDGETVPEARAAFIDNARYEINKALERTLYPLEFKIIETSFNPDL